MQRCIPRILPPWTWRAMGSMDLRSSALNWPTMELKKCSRGSLRAKHPRNWSWNAWSSSRNPSTSRGVRSNCGMENTSPSVRCAGNIFCLLVVICAFRGSVDRENQPVKYRCRCRGNVDVADRACPVCACYMHVCDHRYHHLWTLQGPTQVVNRLVRCPEPAYESRGRTFSPAAALSISMPRWCLGWDVFCWLGHRRFARHWSVPQLRAELQDTHQIRLSDDAIEHYIGRYQTMLAARQQDPARLADGYQDITSLVLTIDGLQPEKGHETLYVVRELMRKRVWFAEPLLSSATQEVRRLIALARQWAERLDKPVRVWMSDKQDAFVKAIAAEF